MSAPLLRVHGRQSSSAAVAPGGRGDAVPRPQLRVTVLGTPEHEGRLCGRAFELLGVEPVFALDGLPHALDAQTPDVVVVSREWSRATRVAVARARRRGIPVVYVMDGVIEWSYVWNNLSYIKPEGSVLQPMLASHLCAVGRHPARILAGLGLADRLHVVGLPRLDDVDRRRIIDPAAPPSIVVATARTWGHNVEQKTFVRRAVRDLKRWFDGHAFIRPVWRIAPELAAELNLACDDTGPLLEQLRHAHALVSFTSTTLLEGMLMGVPTAVVDYRAVPQYVQTAWEIRSPEHVESVLHDLLHPRPERLALQDWCLREELEPGDASARLAEVIGAAAAGETRSQSGEPLAATAPASSPHDFGRLDYRQVHSELSAFAVSPMSVLQYELDATSTLLDFAMPDIVHLRSEVARLQDEVLRLQRDADVARAETERGHAAYAAQKQLWLAQEERIRAQDAALAESRRGADEARAHLVGLRRRLYTERLRPFVRTLKTARVKRLTIYGAGEVGQALLPLCRDAGIEVRRLVDRNPELWGRIVDGVEVTPLEAVRGDRTPAVAIASFSFATEMRAAVAAALPRRRGLRVFAPARWNI